MIKKANLLIRQENEEDQDHVFALVQSAFEDVIYSDKSEHHLVNRLRKSEAFIPELSIIAEYDGQLIGHILLSRIKILHGSDFHDSLALAPVSVLPSYQRHGVGTKLIRYAHDRAKELGHNSVILIGHKDYYPRFGYQPLASFGIDMPFEVPPENCMAKELKEGALDDVKGLVKYPAAFMG